MIRGLLLSAVGLTYLSREPSYRPPYDTVLNDYPRRFGHISSAYPSDVTLYIWYQKKLYDTSCVV